MKRQIRRSVFETNSSSTHSVSISTNKKKLIYSYIPKNSKVILKDDWVYGTDIFDEMGKLNYIVTMLASIIECKYEYDELEIEKSFESMISLDWFKWLAEVVQEESNTEVVYINPTYTNGNKKTYFPYYDTTYDEYDLIEAIFTNYDSEVMTNKEKFKDRVRDIIYNKNVTIEDKENEY